MDCVYSSWSTRDPEGFSDADIAALRRLVPALGLAIKSAALAKVAGTLVEVYLGRDAGRRVLEGRIQRGVADRIEAVAVVLRPAQLHHHHRHRRAGARSSRC